jgi:hypothetical protein
MLGMIALFITILSSGPGTVMVERGIVRQGPGTYYPILTELSRGSELTILADDNEGWLTVRSGSVTGYISSRAVSPGLARLQQSARRTAVAEDAKAALRRISREAATRLGVPERDLELLEQVPIDPMRYQQFRDDTYPRGQRASTYRRSMRLPDLDNGMLFYPIQEEGAGWAIAAGLASRGLYRNTELQQYLTYVGNMVAAASHGYDLGFRFYVLDVSDKQSYSTPGGFIFVTKGLLQIMESEAELVAVLAHEIAHVTLRHGLKEMANTRNVVAADAAFRELDESVDRTDEERQTTVSVNNELITYRERMYSMRNQDFEREADAMALVYIARTGYSPQAMLNIVTRLQNVVSSDAPIYAVNELNNRRDALLAEMIGPKWRGNLMTNAPRYLDIRSRIR